MKTIFKIIKLLSSADSQFICEWVYSNKFLMITITGTDKDYYASVKLNDENIEVKLKNLHSQIKNKLENTVYKGVEYAAQDTSIERIL